jgi:hypothetical protein
MQDKSSNPLGLAPSTWITLAIAVMGIFALKQIPFQDARPTDRWVPTYSHTASEDQDVEARLWQDPFAAVETARKVDDAQRQKNPDGTPLSDVSMTSTCSALLAAKKPDSTPVRDLHSARHLCESFARKSIGSLARVLVLGAIVSGAPYAADIENRRRMRYAVLAGLYRSGYMPVNNQHVGYVRLAEFYGDPTRANDLAPFEWFDGNQSPGKSRPEHVLLLWLDQDGFRVNPIRQFTKIVDGIMPSSVPALILGPADSDGLRAIVMESGPSNASSAQSLRRIDIYSPRATAAAEEIDARKTVLPTQLYFPTATVQFHRTIASDREVAGAVRRELSDRNIQVGDIALIAERDTLYGRAMGQYFQGCNNPPSPDPSSPPVYSTSFPLCLTYLKGLDGIGPPPPKQAAGASGAVANQPNTSDQQSNADTASDASTGPRQLDYLRRTGAALSAMQGAPLPGCKPSDRHNPLCEPHYIKAIGVLGTDIYDKLLVLQALRPTFPDVVFFTFDLDARYTDVANRPWTRELLVGSSLGLSLRPELQGDIPAFRDSYQATTFYATMLALHRASAASSDRVPSEVAGLQWTSHPMVFEIGRKQPIDLLIDNYADRPCQFDDECPSLSANRMASFQHAVTPAAASGLIVLVPGLLWILLCAALGRVAMRRRFGRWPVTATGVVLALALTAALAMRMTSSWADLLNYVTRDGDHMPMPIADGASHWGKELLEACLIPLVIALLMRGQRKLNANAEKIGQLFGFARDYRWLIDSYGTAIRAASWRCKIREWLYFPIGHLSNESDGLPLLPGTSMLESVIARYLYRGIWTKRWLRVLVATFVFILVLRGLEWLGFSLFAGVPWAVTQARKHGIEGWIAFACFTMMQVLIFWVIDAILLTRAFLLDVARDEPAWPADALAKMQTELGLPGDLASIWLNLRLLARRTGWVSNFIWYPSLVIAGMFAATFTVEYGRYRFDTNPVTFIASIVLIVGCIVVLREGAEGWRSEVLAKLSNRRLILLAAVPPNTVAVTQLQVLIDLVTQLHDGAFAPYSEQPLVRAVLLPAVTFAATAGFPYINLS